MFSPLFTEVKLKGMGQGFPGLNPSGGQAFMYQAQTQPTAPLQPTPVSPPPTPTPTSVVPVGVTPVLPPSPAAASGGAVPTKYIAGAIALVAFLGALVLPSSR